MNLMPNSRFPMPNAQYKRRKQLGMSVIEVVLAAAIFVIFASSAVKSLLENYNANRTGAEFTVATQFASEGLEAARSIKNQGYSNLVNSAGTGVSRVGNVWTFGGANNTLTHNSSDNYIRTIKVEAVNRDGTPPAGNVVSSGGTTDADTKKITSTVTWNFGPGRPETLSLVTYLTDWKKAIVALGDALAIYGDIANLAQPRYRTYDNSTNSFSSESAAGSGFTDTLVGKNFFVQTSPTKVEAIAGYVNNSGVLRVLCFDGSTWSSEWTVTVGGTGTNDGRFSIAFEKTTGDAMVVYSTNTATTNEMAYRTKAGSSGCGSANWAAATNITSARTNGIVHWIRMENSPVSGSNNIALAWADAASDLSAMIWTGAGWTIAEPSAALETELERVSASQDSLSFDLAYESLSGDLMVVWGLNQATTCTAGAAIAATNCIRYRTNNGSWSAANLVIPTVADPATNIDLAANPNSDQMVVASVDNNQADLSIAYWSGSAWTGFANVDTSSQAVTAGSKRVATGWLINGATTRFVVVYNDSGTANIGWYVSNATITSAPVAQTDFTVSPVFANPQQWYRIDMDPNDKDRLMFSLSDNASDLFAKRLVMTAAPAFTWTNTEGGAALENSLGQATSRPFGFAYWRNP